MFRNPTYEYRGKFELAFIYTFLRYLIEDANCYKKYLKIKTKFNIDKALMLSSLSQYAETPLGLIKYIEQFN